MYLIIQLIIIIFYIIQVIYHRFFGNNNVMLFNFISVNFFGLKNGNEQVYQRQHRHNMQIAQPQVRPGNS